MVEAFWGDGAPIKGYLARRRRDRRAPGSSSAPPRTARPSSCAARLAGSPRTGTPPCSRTRCLGPAAPAAVRRRSVPRSRRLPCRAHRLADLRGGVAYLQAEAGLAVDRIGLLGFGFGGLVAWEAAQGPLAPGGRALVVYGARPASLTHPDRLEAAVQAHYGARDRRALADLPDLEQRLREAGCVHELRVHAGLGPAFWERWNAAAAPAAVAAAEPSRQPGARRCAGSRPTSHWARLAWAGRRPIGAHRV